MYFLYKFEGEKLKRISKNKDPQKLDEIIFDG
jgi:hypothetical protein